MTTEVAQPNYAPKADSILSITDFKTDKEKAAEAKEKATEAKEGAGEETAQVSQAAGDAADEPGSELNNEPEAEGGQRQKRVEMSPEVQEIYNAQYAQAEQQKRIAAQLADANTKLMREVERMKHDMAVEKHELIVAQHILAKEKALTAGDARAVAEIDNKIVELQLKSAELKKVGEALTIEAKPKQEQQRQQAGFFQSLPPQSQEVLLAWATEANPKGEPLRPWLHPQHPQHKIACAEMQTVLTRNPGGQLSTLLPELDRRMGLTSNGARTAINGASSVKSPSSRRPILTLAQKNIAAKMGLSEKDYLDGLGA